VVGSEADRWVQNGGVRHGRWIGDSCWERILAVDVNVQCQCVLPVLFGDD
jgi:hypothetical protein